METMSSAPLDPEQHQLALQLDELKRTLDWTQVQKEHLLDQLDLARLENQRLQSRVEELERQIAELIQQRPLF